MLETLFPLSRERDHPLLVALHSFIATTISIIVAIYVFPSAASLVYLFLVTMGLYPLLRSLLAEQEERDECIGDHICLSFLEKHGQLLTVYLSLFLGVALATGLWYTVLPDDMAKQAFGLQESTLAAIRGMATSQSSFLPILSNNLRVAMVCYLVSLLFGTGALFVLSWNAGVVGVYVGVTAREMGIHPVAAYAIAAPTGLLGIALHGVPEIAAYSLAGMAGTILSMGLSRKKHARTIAMDSLALLTVSLAMIVIAAMIEAFVTPLL